MNHAEFDWDFENIAHLARHSVTPEEAEQVYDFATVFLRFESTANENRVVEVGRTSHGRILEVVTTQRKGKTRFVTAYKPSKSSLFAYHLAVGGA